MFLKFECEFRQDNSPIQMQTAFKREVSETFLRCVADGYDQELAVIELNGLKIAEHRDFAHCARYILTTILALCLPAPPKVKPEYRSLFPETLPDPASPVSAHLQLESMSITSGPHLATLTSVLICILAAILAMCLPPLSKGPTKVQEPVCRDSAASCHACECPQNTSQKSQCASALLP
jgi:translation initiation factor eIF-2B subunit epsilon